MNSVRFFLSVFADPPRGRPRFPLSQRPGLISPKTGVAVHKMTSQAAIIAGKAKRHFSIRPMSVARMLPIFSHLGSHLNAWPSAWFLASNRLALGQDSAHAEALAPDDYLPLVRAALTEDIGSGDATTLALVPEDALSTAVMTAREPLVMAGVDLALASFQEVDERIDFGIEVRDGQDGDFIQPLLRLQGPTRALLTAERTALNFVQRLSGVATLTAQFVQQGGRHRRPDSRHPQDHTRLARVGEIRRGLRRRHQSSHQPL